MVNATINKISNSNKDKFVLTFHLHRETRSRILSLERVRL